MYPILGKVDLYTINIIDSLAIDDLVMFRGEKHRWKGTAPSIIDGTLCFVLERDGKGKNGKSTDYYPFERNKHQIKPYYGSSKTTGGTGVSSLGLGIGEMTLPSSHAFLKKFA